ncbi:MAG: DUF2207 domain-containing protein [Candidatus Saccharibacteria bacterium]
MLKRHIPFVLVLFALLSVSLAGLLPARVHAQDTSNFAVQSFGADYYLTRDAKHQSHLKTVETITADFPSYDQNHGIERAIPNSYDGHTVKLAILSVMSLNGQPWSYQSIGEGDNTLLRIGDANTYVHGEQTYVISYTSQDVTKNFQNDSEFYWDTNGTGWQQAFGAVTARVHIPSSLANAYDGRLTCFTGTQGAAGHDCIMQKTTTATETLLTITATRSLNPGENMTFVAGFKPDTFATYQKTWLERWGPTLLMAWFAIGALVLVTVIVRLIKTWRAFGRSPQGRGTIIPEYTPPKDVSVLLSSTVLRKTGASVTAQIIDLAVRHYVRIYDEPIGRIFKKHTFSIELIKLPDDLHDEERQLLTGIFGQHPDVGTRVSLAALQNQLYKKAEILLRDTQTHGIQLYYIADRVAVRKRLYWTGGILAAGGLLLLNPGPVIAGIVTIIVASRMHPLTEKGVTLRDYLLGMRDYMQMAEADRIRVLQSPEGAERVRVDASDTQQLVKLYERLLSYAIIFGIEQHWAQEFAGLYQQPPDWYAGNWTTFNAAVFASSLGGFSTASTTAFTPPSSSTGSGFSAGSGFSGGGGGGGGGGGW